MTAKEFLLDYIQNHPDNLDKNGKPYYKNLTKFFKDNGGDFNHVEKIGYSRWWDDLIAIQKINGRFIQYQWASTTGDKSIFDVGWEFDEDSICFVEAYTETVTVTKYRKIDE